MSTVGPLLRLRRREIGRTWRIAVLPSVVFVLAVSGPVLARFSNELLVAALSEQAGGSITLPEPTAVDAVAQWTKNLSQIVVLVVVVMAAGAINAEIRSGVAAFLLVKPAGRTTYVLTHAGVLIGFVGLTAFVGAGVSWAITRAVFGTADAGAFFGATAVWLVLAAALIAASLLASAGIDAAAGAAGIGIGASFVLVLLGVVPALAEYSPAGLIRATAAVGTGTQPADHTLWWPVMGGLLLTALLLAGAVVVFRRREL